MPKAPPCLVLSGEVSYRRYSNVLLRTVQWKKFGLTLLRKSNRGKWRDISVPVLLVDATVIVRLYVKMTPMIRPLAPIPSSLRLLTRRLGLILARKAFPVRSCMFTCMQLPCGAGISLPHSLITLFNPCRL